MKISKRIYIDEDVTRHKWTIWKLRRDKNVEKIYCIIYTDNGALEIIKSTQLKDKHSKSILIGMATSKQNALELLRRIFDEVYRPNPKIQEMKDYFIADNS